MVDNLYSDRNKPKNVDEVIIFDEKLLICHPKHFKSYFKLDDVVKVLPEKEVNILVDMINSKESEEKSLRI